MSVVSGTTQAILGREGAEAQAEAAQYSSDLQANMFLINREDMMPSLLIQREREELARDAFRDAIEAIGTPFQFEYEETPGYQFQREEGEKAIQRASGLFGGGGRAIKEATRFQTGLLAQDMMGQRRQALAERQQNIQNLLSVAQGPGAVTNVAPTLASLGASAAARIGEAQQDVGAARASGYFNIANVAGQQAQVGQNLAIRYLANRFGLGGTSIGGGGGATGGGGIIQT